MSLSQAIRMRLLHLIKERHLSAYSLSMTAGISPSIINDFFRKKVEYPRLDNLFYICQALGIELKDFFDDNIFVDIDM